MAAAVGDADSSVRVTARRGYWVLRMRFPALAQSVMDSLSPSMQVGVGDSGGGGRWTRGGCIRVIHACSHKTVDPPIHLVSGHRFFHRPGRHCLHQAQSALRCSASVFRGGGGCG